MICFSHLLESGPIGTYDGLKVTSTAEKTWLLLNMYTGLCSLCLALLTIHVGLDVSQSRNISCG